MDKIFINDSEVNVSELTEEQKEFIKNENPFLYKEIIDNDYVIILGDELNIKVSEQ